jgi:drug/metabolite transporter (DMT)-like permease
MTSSPSSLAWRALLVMGFVNIIWGAAFPITKPALLDMPPITFAFVRFVVAILCLIPLAPRATWQLLSGPARRQFIIMGIIGFTITQITQVWSLVLSPAIHIALLSTTTPIWVGVMAAIWLGEPFTRRMQIGTLIAMIGILIVLDIQLEVSTQWQSWVGYAIYLISALGWAAYNVMGRNVMQQYDALPSTTAAAIVGVIVLLPFAVGEYLNGQTTHFTVASITGVLYTGIGVTVFGYVALFWALRHVAPSQVAAMMYIQPIAGTIVAWLWLNEQPGLNFFVGALLTFVGVGLVNSQPTSRTQAPRNDAVGDIGNVAKGE